MFDLFMLRDAAQRRVKGQFEAQAKARATVAGTVQADRRSVRRTASASALRLRPESNR